MCGGCECENTTTSSANFLILFNGNHGSICLVLDLRLWDGQRTHDGSTSTYRCRSANQADSAFHPFGVDK